MQDLIWPSKPIVDIGNRVDTLTELFETRANLTLHPRPLLLDLCCGAGGAGMGYYRAGFDVVGIDIAPQPNYPFPMIQTDAVSWINVHSDLLVPNNKPGWGFNAIHASPPCQRWSQMSNCRKGLAQKYPDLLTPIRALLDDWALLPWVIENVVGAPLRDPIMLCGTMFGYDLFRHRLFEAGGGFGKRGEITWRLDYPIHKEWINSKQCHTKPGSRAGHWEPGTVISVCGNCAPMAEARKQMEIHWTNRSELVEAIPPYYTEYIGKQIIDGFALADRYYRWANRRAEAV